MNELHAELDQALRALPVSEAPVERARRAGHRLRLRRRAAVAAGALTVLAAAAGYPALSAIPQAAPAAPAARQQLTAEPAPDATRGPTGLTGKLGVLAQGRIGRGYWRTDITALRPDQTMDVQFCYGATAPPSPGSCAPFLNLPSDNPSGGDPASFDGSGDIGGASFQIAAVARDVPYLVVSFADGQQLKLIPVTVNGQRYVSWAAPRGAAVASVTAHLGAPYTDDGQTATAIPFQPVGTDPVFGLWLRPGQTVPRAEKQIGFGPTDGRQWSATAYVGPWGTCLQFSVGQACLPSASFAATQILGWVGSETAGVMFGSAARGVTAVRLFLSDGSAQEVKVAQVGDERLFALWTKKNVHTVGWLAYSASGQVVGSHGTVPPRGTCPESAVTCPP